ncbi:MAG: flagellar hook basal-body protein [Anaeromyxobacter sp.]|nr:flagellar hook basal-body protein [Anaeromyxobacter sp.]MBL0276167.1 flagellar hook basal-body protein [Anaeromyxobacter sp.]
MADGIYISMCGAVARAEQLDSIADNLANAQTPGFKASRPAFETFLSPSGAQDKHYAAAVATATDLRAGPTTHSGNPLDVLPDEGAFLAVRTQAGGTAYTRDGRLTLDAARRLVSGAGQPVLDDQGHPIVIPPDLTPTVDDRGRVHAGALEVGQLALVRLEGPVDRLGPASLAPGQGGRAVPVEASVRTGEIELGNASALEATIGMVSAQRSYDTAMQAIQTYRQLDQRAAELGRTR